MTELFLPSQFAKSQEFSNVRALQIFKRNVLFSVLNSRTIFERDLRSSDSVAKFATQNLGFSDTDLTASYLTISLIQTLYWEMVELLNIVLTVCFPAVLVDAIFGWCNFWSISTNKSQVSCTFSQREKYHPRIFHDNFHRNSMSL